MFLFVLATKLTTAANAVFPHDTAPVRIALISPWVLGERTRRHD
jgi:drug/metabolite transporter, DME family